MRSAAFDSQLEKILPHSFFWVARIRCLAPVGKCGHLPIAGLEKGTEYEVRQRRYKSTPSCQTTRRIEIATQEC